NSVTKRQDAHASDLHRCGSSAVELGGSSLTPSDGRRRKPYVPHDFLAPNTRFLHSPGSSNPTGFLLPCPHQINQKNQTNCPARGYSFDLLDSFDGPKEG